MNTDTAIHVLEECEAGLRKALAEAGAAGDYDAARQIMLWAEALHAQISAAKAAPAPPAAPGLAASLAAPASSASPKAAAPPGKRRMIQDEYPRFLRRGDELVKVGWSKSENKEYNHRAPRPAIDAVVAAIKRLTANGQGFVSEDLSPLKSPAGGLFPTYQIFVALGWLRQLGLLHQPGRKSAYALVKGMPLDATVETKWKALAAWRG